MAEPQAKDPIRQETPPPKLNGTFSFPCCGFTHTIKADRIVQVVCPICRTSYDIQLVPRRRAAGLYPRGTRLRLLQDYKTKVGAGEPVLKKGAEYSAGSDPHGMLGTNEGHSVIEVPSPVASHPDSYLVAIIPNEFLQEVLPLSTPQDLTHRPE